MHRGLLRKALDIVKLLPGERRRENLAESQPLEDEGIEVGYDRMLLFRRRQLAKVIAQLPGVGAQQSLQQLRCCVPGRFGELMLRQESRELRGGGLDVPSFGLGLAVVDCCQDGPGRRLVEPGRPVVVGPPFLLGRHLAEPCPERGEQDGSAHLGRTRQRVALSQPRQLRDGMLHLGA